MDGEELFCLLSVVESEELSQVSDINVGGHVADCQLLQREDSYLVDEHVDKRTRNIGRRFVEFEESAEVALSKALSDFQRVLDSILLCLLHGEGLQHAGSLRL